jgi:DNA-directed RNA polymerase specialized sigma24 family protein
MSTDFESGEATLASASAASAQLAGADVADRVEFMQACIEGGARFSRAIRTLLTHNGGRLRRDALQFLGSPSAADDALQNTVIKAWRRCKTYRGDASVRSWLRGILRYEVLDQLSARRPDVPAQDENGE